MRNMVLERMKLPKVAMHRWFVKIKYLSADLLAFTQLLGAK